jgi:hypothetical protein
VLVLKREHQHRGNGKRTHALNPNGLAENESVSIAENNKWSVRRRFQNGTFKISYPPYGYDTVDGKLIANESQADIVRFVFAEILSGKGTHKIADELNRRNVPSKKGHRWTATTIRGMVGNEKYTGDAVFQKTYTDSQFNRHYNYGEKDQFLIKNHHDAIISHDDFKAAQAIIEQRGKEKGLEKQNKISEPLPLLRQDLLRSVRRQIQATYPLHW